jgi:hypothetical protein
VWSGQISSSIGWFLPTTLPIEQCLPGQASAHGNHVSNDGLDQLIGKSKAQSALKTEPICRAVPNAAVEALSIALVRCHRSLLGSAGLEKCKPRFPSVFVSTKNIRSQSSPRAQLAE